MSDAIRVGLIAEGPTDKIVLEAVIASMVGDRRFIMTQLQPEESLPFGRSGTGWVGVYRWCALAVARAAGSLRTDVIYETFDIIVFQLDADVADKSYGDGAIVDPILDLPCAEPCPPPEATTNRLREVLLRWLGETQVPERTVLCTPSKSLETWVVASLFPNDPAIQENAECLPHTEARLQQQPIDVRIRKSQADYRSNRDKFQSAWPRLTETLSEAARFQADFLAEIS